MFRSREEARARFEALAATKSRVEAILDGLRPAIGFAPQAVAGEAPLGGTRMGGTPDLPPGLDWPIRPAAANIEEIARRGGESHAGDIRKYRGRDLPFEFLAQIDLAEAAALGAVASDLPGEGRLLFFYDSMSGPWDSGGAVCRVIWDRSPRESLRRLPLPDILAKLGEEHARGAYEGSVEILKKHDLPPPKREEFTSPFWGPARALRLVPLLTLSAFAAIEATTDPGLKALFRDGEVVDALGEMIDEGRAHSLLLGLPIAEQDDPRYEVVTGGAGMDEDEKARRALEWRLLLQVPLADYMQKPAEGTVYFLIRSADLASRHYERVVAVYQQT